MQDDNATCAGWEALSLRLAHGDPCTRGISASRLEAIGKDLHALARVEGHPEHDPRVRRTLRYLCTLVHEDMPDARLPDIVCQLVDHPALPLEVVREVLRGEGEGVGRETSGAALRRVARCLGAGDSIETAASAEGVSLHVAGQVSRWIGVEEARTEALELAAAAWLYSDGGSAASFARAHGIGFARAWPIDPGRARGCRTARVGEG